MRWFRLLFVLDVGIAVVFGLVFCVGSADALAERHVDREDLVLWPALMVGVGGVLGGAAWLRSRRMARAATGLLLAMVAPGVAAGVFVVSVVVAMLHPGAFR